MKIAVIVWDLSVSGGTQRQAIELANHLADKHEVVVYTYGFNAERCYPELVKNLNIKYLVKDVAKVERPGDTGKLAQLRFDSYQQFHLFDSQIKELAGIIEEGFDVLNLHDLFTERVAYYYLKRSPGAKTVWMSNDVPGIFQIQAHNQQHPRQAGSWKGWISIKLQNFLFWLEVQRELRFVRPINEVVVLDKRNQDQFKHYMDKDARIIRSGLDLERFSPNYTKSNKTFTILGTGILFRLRRFEDLIDSVKILLGQGHSVHLNIVGSDEFDASYGSELRSRVKKHRVTDNVSFLGRVTEEELQHQYRNADVFAFPNHNQTWGLAVFEAMASGTPVIVSKTAGAHEVLEDGVNALLVEPCQPEEIAERIEQLIKDPRLRQKLSKNGREFVEKNISWPIYAQNMLKVFEDVAKG